MSYVSYMAIFKGGPDDGRKISLHDKLPNICIAEPVEVVHGTTPCDYTLIIHEYRLVREISGNFLIYKWEGSSE